VRRLPLAIAALGALLSQALLSHTLWAATPQSMQVAGTLQTVAGGAAPDGTYTLTFSLYAEQTATKPVWTEAVALPVLAGSFGYVLGSKTLLPGDVAAQPQLWLGVQIGTDPELPRKQLHAVAYALRAAVAEGLDCSGCIKAGQLDPGVLTEFAKSAALAKVATSGDYADLKGGPDLSGYAKSAALAKVATSGDYADLQGAPDLAGYAQTAGLAAVAVSGKYADLNGLPTLAKLGASCGTGLVVKGLAADGSLVCIAALDPSALPPDGLSAISNGQLTNQFTDVASSTATPAAIPDNNPVGVSIALDVPDLGTAQALSVQVDIANSDTSSLKVIVIDPAGGNHVLWDKSAPGTAVKGSWPDKQKLVTGDLAAWVGKNPKGKWYLTAIDSGFVNNAKDGQVASFTVTIGTLSSKKVQSNGLLVTAGGLQLQTAASHPVTCDATRFGYLYANTADKAVYVCNGKDFFPISVATPGTQDNPAVSCKDILAKAPASKDGVYWLDPDGALGGIAAYQTLCDMTTSGGGWTLVFQRRSGYANKESFGANVNEFVQTKGGSAQKLGYDDSFSVGMGNRPAGVKEWLFVDFNANLSPDTDDAFILLHDQNLFPSSTGGNDLAVGGVCDINGANCDKTNVFFKWFGSGYFGSTYCNSGQSFPYGGNYGYCQNGVGASYESNGLFGNRVGYAETKLWDHTETGYMERVFVR
jgi:subtilisin-like proprotein convertase family protein